MALSTSVRRLPCAVLLGAHTLHNANQPYLGFSSELVFIVSGQLSYLDCIPTRCLNSIDRQGHSEHTCQPRRFTTDSQLWFGHIYLLIMSRNADASQEVRAEAGLSSASTSTHGRKRTSDKDATASSSFVYNPRQDVNDRRKVRSDYRQLIAQAEESKRDSSLKPKDLLEFIVKADELHERVVAPSESILDTKTLSSMSEMGARMAKKMKLHQDAFDTHEFMTRLARFLGGEAAPVRGANRSRGADQSDDDEDDDSARNLERWDWAKLGRLAASVSRRAVTMDFMLGPLDSVPKTRKAATQRRVEEAPAERTAPRALQQQDLQNSAGRESTSQILRVAQLLQQQGPDGVCLFKFAVDPESFVNTVENFFHVSFLIKENKASLRTDRQGNAILGK